MDNVVAQDGGAALGMRIEFRAYADDYTIDGDMVLAGERLADFLDRTHDIDVGNVTVRALEDAREHRLPSAVIRREELCAVAATGPRGQIALRLRTRSYPMRFGIGPYVAVGYFHALTTADPLAVMQRRRVVALSPARLAFDIAGARVEETHDTLLLLRAKVGSLEYVTDAEVGLPQPLAGR